jgi:outer membrane protein
MLIKQVNISKKQKEKKMFFANMVSERNKASLRLIILMIFVLILPAIAKADGESPEIKLSLTEAVETALRDNHEVKAQRSDVLSQKNQVGIARSAFLPKLSFEERYLLTTTPSYAFMSRLNQASIEQQDFDPNTLNNPDSTADFQTSFTIEQVVYAQKAFIGYAMSKREVKAKQKDYSRKKEDTAYQVLKTYLDVRSAKEYVSALKECVAESEENLRIANSRYRNGLGQYADTLRSATELNQAKQRLNSAEKNLFLDKSYLALLLSIKGEADTKDEKTQLEIRDIDYYIGSAQSRNDLAAAEIRHKNAKDNISMARSGYLPFLGVGGAYQLNDANHVFGDEGKSWQVGAFLRWDLFDGAKRESEIGKARNQEMQMSESIASMKQKVEFGIRESYLNAREAGKNIELAKMSLETAEEGARLVRVRYSNGLASFDDLLSAQAALEKARAAKVEHENMYLSAVGMLSYQSGVILKDLNINDSDGE